VVVFTALTLIVTLIHIDKFHFNAPALITRMGTWVWLAVYASVPLIMGVLALFQLRAPGSTPPRQYPLAQWMRAILLVNAGVLILLGLALLFAPLEAMRLWPWTLTPLTARAIGAWLVGLGIAAAHETWENDLLRVGRSWSARWCLACCRSLRWPATLASRTGAVRPCGFMWFFC
jgi:hypothetical protein